MVVSWFFIGNYSVMFQQSKNAPRRFVLLSVMLIDSGINYPERFLSGEMNEILWRYPGTAGECTGTEIVSPDTISL